jgi:energy-coupling factor transport system ATP-binding protein
LSSRLSAAPSTPPAPVLRLENVHHTYQSETLKTPVHALRGVSLSVAPGEYVVILGHNGSGKSTLAKHLNGLLLPAQGDVWVRDWNTKDRARLREIRSTVGMVFQTPDNQIVATIVEEDVAFGPENLGLPYAQLVERVDWALEQVNMATYRKRAPHLLSGGQKQRVCIAGVLAMRPEVLVLDEATAMLDPLGRKEVLAVARRLNREEGVTVVAITHFMHEAVGADRVIVMAEGQIALEGTPHEVFSQAETLRALRLDLPPITQLAAALHERCPDFPANVLTQEEFLDAARACAKRRAATGHLPPIPNNQSPISNLQSPISNPEPLIVVEDLQHFYMRGTPLAVQALFDVHLRVHRGEVVGIIGHTGSGKSTVVQHLNGLLRPHGGRVVVLGQELGDPKADVRAVRRRVGLVFQFAEAQLFEQYVGDDVAYGPRKMGLGREEVRARVRRAMELVGLGFEEFKDRLTFALSGGQMRRVALAGVLALEPEVLVLDEPTAGLDPQGRRQLLEHILALHGQGITLVIISHNMDELAEICDRLIVIAGGKTVMEGSPGEVFARAADLKEIGLDVPETTEIANALAAAGLLPPGTTVYTVEQALDALAAVMA